MARKPQQSRSKATVVAIIEAAFICVAERGTNDTTTRQIAEKAGIGVGSLYEYFPNKGAVFDAMNQRFVVEVVTMIQPMMAELVRMPVTDMIRTLLKSFEGLLRKNDDRYLKCVRAVIRLEIKDYMGPINRILSELVTQHLMHNPENLRVREIPTMTYIFINGGIFALIRHLSDPNPPISFDQLTEGLALMVGHYIAQERLLTQSGAALAKPD